MATELNPAGPGTAPSQRPRALIVGGCDVHRRIDLMRSLAGEFSLAAVGSEPALREPFDRAGFHYYHVPLGRGASPLADLRALTRLVRLFQTIRPDIVHTFATKPSVWGRIAARLAGVPVIIGTLPGLGSLYATRRLTTRVLRALYQPLQKLSCTVSSATIFQNDEDARQLIAAGTVAPHKAFVIPGSGIRTDLYRPASVPLAARIVARAELGAGHGSIVVTMVSRVIRSKGVLEFAEAAALVRRRHPDAEFVLIGPDDRESLDRLTPAEREHVSRSVRWLGERQDIPALLAASDLFVLPSFYREGIPRALLEAASMGLPLITTTTPGCVEVVEDGKNGFLVPPRDPGSLAEAIERLIRAPRLRQSFGQASRELAVRRFDISVIAARTAALYRELLARIRAANPLTADVVEHGTVTLAGPVSSTPLAGPRATGPDHMGEWPARAVPPALERQNL